MDRIHNALVGPIGICEQAQAAPVCAYMFFIANGDVPTIG
jgi:hypothetical protein